MRVLIKGSVNFISDKSRLCLKIVYDQILLRLWAARKRFYAFPVIWNNK
jgi:hypothetical protein